MNRREYLDAVGGVSLVGLSGCSSATGALDFGGSNVGETASYNGVEITPTKYVLSSSFTAESNHNTEDVDAPSGATYVFTHLSAVHNGDSEQQFPRTRLQSNIAVKYNGEQIYDTGVQWNSVESYVVEDKPLTTYGAALREEGATNGAYPGTEVEGWLCHEVAENFDPTNLVLSVTWNPQIVGDEGETTQSWTYTEDTEVPISEVEVDSTIVL